nr:MAG TPA: hypothetical protein [Caudoviricetes sp.]
MGLCDRRMGPYFSERNAMIQGAMPAKEHRSRPHHRS